VPIPHPAEDVLLPQREETVDVVSHFDPVGDPAHRVIVDLHLPHTTHYQNALLEETGLPKVEARDHMLQTDLPTLLELQLQTVLQLTPQEIGVS
jgi:hypothetical protein